MDPSDLRPSPRRELQLQGPRPTPLRVSKDSYKIKKPPMAPPGPAHHPPPHPQNRAPVIIYTVSPKVIHTNPGDFMTLVQRLTGSSSAAAAAASGGGGGGGGGGDLPSPSFGDGGAISPAARLATYERAARSPDGGRQRMNGVGDVAEVGGGGGVEMGRAAAFPGILSPVPSSLPPISPSLFSPPSDPAFLSFLHDLSPGFGAGGGGGGFSTSPSSFLMTPTIPSPGVWDLFNQWPGS